MGLFTNLFGDRTSEKFGDSWLDTYFSQYQRIRQSSRAPDPYQHLIEFWLHQPLPSGADKKLLDQMVQSVAVKFACLPEPDAGMAMSLFLLGVNHPEVMANNLKYHTAYQDLMGALLAMEKAGDFDFLNDRFNTLNPNVSLRSPFPVTDPAILARGRNLGVW